jgi:hypothetical protein
MCTYAGLTTGCIIDKTNGIKLETFLVKPCISERREASRAYVMVPENNAISSTRGALGDMIPQETHLMIWYFTRLLSPM